MSWPRRIACIVVGCALVYFAAQLAIPEIEAGRFVVRVTIAAGFMTFCGALLVMFGAFPKFTNNW
ncbi:hypothetical protein [Methylobacterium sp. JK268]